MTAIRMTLRCKNEDLPDLPKKVQASLVNKLAVLQFDPRYGKPLWGPLKQYKSLRLGRYRIIYRYELESDVVWVVAVGIRRAGGRDDIYAKISAMIP
ncbi:MAG: type II toxin-antitoxin system RelE/ParE family toxin [Chloroflexota bacterium]|nr:type II toxin-antitoxin system RelE/ParE family toxin [Chloroflexota bacterium]